MKRIISILNQDIRATENMLKQVHMNLIELLDFRASIPVVLEELFEDNLYQNLLNGEWGYEILSSSTIELMNKFQKRWSNYRREAQHSDDARFIIYDPIWQEIISKYLIPTLNSIERDFDSSGIEHKGFMDYFDPSDRPSDDDLLDRAHTLYGLLIRHGIIKKLYLS